MGSLTRLIATGEDAVFYFLFYFIEFYSTTAFILTPENKAFVSNIGVNVNTGTENMLKK